MKKYKLAIKILTISMLLFQSTFAFPKKVFAGLNTDYVELVVTYKKANGETCAVGSDCVSGSCVDDYCCDTTCDGTCEACDISGSEGTCTNIPVDTDPDNECDSTCVDGCEDQTGNCDGSGACKTTYCSAGTACSAGTCDGANYCNTSWEYCSGQGDGYYDDGGTNYECQGQCDGSGNCDYASNCSSLTENDIDNQLKFSGNLKMENFNFDFEVNPTPTPTPIPCGTLTVDYGGQIYSTVMIGDQCWLRENLNIDPDNADNSDCSGTKYCYNDNSLNCDSYGGLYTWYVAMCGASSSSSEPSGVQGLCPDGWHFPSDAEFDTLISNVCGDDGDEASALAGNPSLWTDGALESDNDFGCSEFDILPAGRRNSSGDYAAIGTHALRWSSTQYTSSDARYEYMVYSATGVSHYHTVKGYHMSVRCVRD